MSAGTDGTTRTGTDGIAELAHRVGARLPGERPGLVGLAGAVACGKTTTAERLAARLGAAGVSASVLGTDAFLHPNSLLAERGLLGVKGFPETFDVERLAAALATLREGRAVDVPVYSHEAYDVVPGRTRRIEPDDAVVVEGVNALQPAVVTHLDVAVYLDAEEDAVRGWFRARFRELRAAARDAPDSFYAAFADLGDDDLLAVADTAWDAVNVPNLRHHIAPTAASATLVVEQGRDHRIQRIVER